MSSSLFESSQRENCTSHRHQWEQTRGDGEISSAHDKQHTISQTASSIRFPYLPFVELFYWSLRALPFARSLLEFQAHLARQVICQYLDRKKNSFEWGTDDMAASLVRVQFPKNCIEHAYNQCVCCFLLDLSKKASHAMSVLFFFFRYATGLADWSARIRILSDTRTRIDHYECSDAIGDLAMQSCSPSDGTWTSRHESLSPFYRWWTLFSRSCGIESPMLVNRRWVWANIWSVKILVWVWHITVSITVSRRPSGISTSLMSAYRTPHVINAMSSKRMDMCQLDQMWSLSSKVNETDRKDNHASVTIKE